MKKITPLIILLVSIGAPVALAEFQEVHTFETGGIEGITLAMNPAADAGGNGSIEVVPDPADAENNVLKLDPGTFANGDTTNNVWFTIPIPEVTGKATVFVRYQGGPLVDIVWGTAWNAEPLAYGDFSSIARVELDTILDYHDGGYVEVPNGAVLPNTWYNTWFVIDVPTNTYDLWIQGGTQWATPTKVATGAAFRSQSNEPQRVFVARMTTGDLVVPKAVDPTYFDDLYIDLTGENITVPGEGGGGPGGDNGTGRLINISTRGLVGAGNDIMIAGFWLDGPRRVLIRAAGPAISGDPFNVPGTLVDPEIRVVPSADPATTLATNDNWGENSAEVLAAIEATQAFSMPDGSADAALVMMLEAGGYTVQVSGKDGGTGVAIVEVYEIPTVQ